MSDTTTLDERAYTVDEACERLGGISRSKLYSEVRAGRLELRKLGDAGPGTRSVVLQSAITRYLRALPTASDR